MVLWLLASPPRSPPVMREGLVGLRHAVEVVLALERAALLLERIEELAGELPGHSLLAPIARERHEPADRERASAPSRHLDGHLIVRAANTARAGLEHGRHRLHRLLEHLDGRLPGALGCDRERVVDDLLGCALLPHRHHAIDHLADEPRLAPYFERACLRSETPAVSSAARITL